MLGPMTITRLMGEQGQTWEQGPPSSRPSVFVSENGLPQS